MDTKVLRQKILDLAIRGKLVPQDPNDEPASVLLDRIRAEKQKMYKEGKLKAKDLKNDSIIFKGEDNLHYEKFGDGRLKNIENEIPFDIPEQWCWSRIYTIASDLPYGTAKKSAKCGQIAVLRMSNIQAGEINYKDLVYSSDKDDIERYSLIRGDLLFNRTNSAEWVGKTAIYRGIIPAIFAGYLIRIRPFISSEYLNTVMNSGYAKSYCNQVKTDAVNQSNINAQKLGSFLIPIPTFKEQLRIEHQIVQTIPIVNELQESEIALKDLILNAKTRILDLAIRGKLVPQDPNDEPASILLEHIRDEREELIKQGKIKRNKKESVIFRGDDNSYYEKIGDTIECIDNVVPFSIPKSWGFARFHTLLELFSGRDLPPQEYNSEHEGIPYITGASNYIDGHIEINRWTTTPQVLTEMGDLLLTCKGTVGELCINDFGKAHIARQIMAIRNTLNLNGEYLQMVLFFYIDGLRADARGLIPGISRDDILELIVPIPPRNYQSNVVSAYKQYIEFLSAIETSFK